MIYLDNNASTPVDPEVADVVYYSLRSIFGNPSSGHDIGLVAKTAIEKARSQVAELIGTSSDEIFFASGGTEANNLAILGAAHKQGKGHIITSAIEHPSVANPCKHLEDRGFVVTYIGVDKDGRVAAEDIKKALRRDTILITIMHANNETGVLQPIEEIGLLAKERAVSFHSDAAQTIGKMTVDISKLNCDMLTIVSHKFYGPKGIGALYVRKGIELDSILFGAGHEKGLRPGTENVPGIIGLGKACEMARLFTDDRASHTKSMAEMLYRALKDSIEGLALNGHETLRLPNTLNICIKGVDSYDLIEEIKNKIAASSGSACHSGKKSPSPVLKAMGLSDADAMSSIRLSVGKDNTAEEIKEAAGIISETIKQLRR